MTHGEVMVLFVPAALIATGTVSAVGGAVSAGRGALLVRKARRIADDAAREYDVAIQATNQAVMATNGRISDYSENQQQALNTVIARMVDFLIRHEQTVTEHAKQLLDGIVVNSKRLEAFTGGTITPDGLVKSIGTAAAAGAATYTSIPLAAAAYGSASTGTAIATLGGAAAQNATLAYLGGGSLAAGGGGMALGAAALNFVTVGPAILITGLAFAGKGQRALTKAHHYAADVGSSIGKQEQLCNRLRTIDQRLNELEDVLANLATRAMTVLDELEACEPFDPIDHGEMFQQAIKYAVAVRDVVATPILDPDGELDPDTERLVVNYRDVQ